MAALQWLDYQLFAWLNSWAGVSPALDGAIVFFGQYLIYPVAAGLIIYWLLASEKLKARRMLLSAFLAFVLSRLVLTELIRRLLPRQRPFLSHQVTQLIAKGAEKSFPSGHASAMFAIAMAVYFYNKRLGGWMLLLAGLISVARVAAGVHYPSDIVGGAVVGIASAWLIEKFLGKYLENWTTFFSTLTDRLLPFRK